MDIVFFSIIALNTLAFMASALGTAEAQVRIELDGQPAAVGGR